MLTQCVRGSWAALAVAIAITLAACSTTTNHTDPKAAMAQMTFSPEKCEQVGAVYRECGGSNSLPGSDAANNPSDMQMLRGTCPAGYHYESGTGCMQD